MPRIGAHVSAAGGVVNAPINAYKEGCECFQFFSRPPQGGPAPVINPADAKKFINTCKKHDLEGYIHTPYYINLASQNNRVKYGSIKVIREELERGCFLKVKYIMTHLGTAAGYSDRKKAITEVIKSLKKTLTGYKGETMFLIENSAGSGQIIGHDFKEIKKIINGLKGCKVGVCLDVMHAFASGYHPAKLFNAFDKEIGLKYLKLIHANDAKSELGSHIDRHEHIGLGNIGKEYFKKWLSDKRLSKINFVLETPKDGRANDLEIMKKLRS
ncbi:MAG: deoxyribonuclease IV [Patescibacteria group bacterium]|jgi:deoxyribonuclease-4